MQTPASPPVSSSAPLLPSLLNGVLLGLLAGIVFIVVQPAFGLSTLTSRHAEAYQSTGGLAPGPAVAIAWFAHLTVSVAYGIATVLLLRLCPSRWLTLAGILALSWITTLIAPPANGLIIALVATQSLPPAGQLPGLNPALDAKFLLHLLFFAGIAFVQDRLGRRARMSAGRLTPV